MTRKMCNYDRGCISHMAINSGFQTLESVPKSLSKNCNGIWLTTLENYVMLDSHKFFSTLDRW
jgi:hypothetical protein